MLHLPVPDEKSEQEQPPCCALAILSDGRNKLGTAVAIDRGSDRGCQMEIWMRFRVECSTPTRSSPSAEATSQKQNLHGVGVALAASVS